MTPQEAIARADDARRLLESPLLQEVLTDEREKWIHAWQVSAALDATYREECWRHLKAAEAFQLRLQAIIDGAVMARIELDRLERQGDRNI